MSKQAPQVLLVDDNPADVQLTREALAGSRYHTDLHNEVDGERALAYLRLLPPRESAERPDLVLLDLNLPGKSGREVLAEIKSDPHLCAIPVVAFSTSRSNRDVVACYEEGANCYVNKPVNLEDFFSAIRAIEQFWFGSARLPEESDDGTASERSFD